MSFFICAKCDNLRDSDDGCDADDGGYGLKCMVCINSEADYEDSELDYERADMADDSWGEGEV